MPSSKQRQRVPSLGETRHSQVLQVHGPGAMVDFPDRSVLIGGLDFWNDHGCEPIHEPRLLQLVRQATGMARVDLHTPPKEDSTRGIWGSIKALRFPEWSVVQKTIPNREAFGITCRARRLVHFNDGCVKDWTKFKDADGEYPIVPVRFVMACPHGHLTDIRWRDFCFGTFGCKNSEPLYLLEAGTGNDFTQIFVQSEGGKTRRLADASIPQMNALGNCQGHTPWLGRKSRDHEPCHTDGQPTKLRLLVRSATNAYFSETLSVISLPEKADRDLAQRVTNSEFKDDLMEITSVEDMDNAFKFNKKLRKEFADVGSAVLLKAINAQRHDTGGQMTEPKDEELALLTGPMDEVSRTAKDSLFEAEIWRPQNAPGWFHKGVDRVLLVHRLREVQALIGFTRFVPRYSSLGGIPIDTAGSGSQRAPLANDLRWVPAVENKGEGIFIAFKRDTIRKWKKMAAVKNRSEQFKEAFPEWLKSYGLNRNQFPFPGAPYILLHSLSHLLITEMALECGYGASAIHERIYANDTIGYGILLITSTSGAEGTMGGLVDAGRRIVRYLERAFERGQLCSNDPFCSEHDPTHPFDIRPSHGAACHGCELIAETSCERHNEFLDRALVSRTVSIHSDGDDPSFWSFINPDSKTPP